MMPKMYGGGGRMMEKLIEKLVIERNRLFVGRGAELEKIHQWIRSMNAPTQVIVSIRNWRNWENLVHDEGSRLSHLANKRTMWIDGRVCAETPTGFMEALFDHMKTVEGLPAHHETSLNNLIYEISKGRTLLCVDNYDAILRIDGWLREVFFSPACLRRDY